jgi:hypothetical protein
LEETPEKTWPQRHGGTEENQSLMAEKDTGKTGKTNTAHRKDAETAEQNGEISKSAWEL